MRYLSLLVTMACGGGSVDTSVPSLDTDVTVAPEAEPPSCEPPQASSCGDKSSIIQGKVRLSPELAGAATSGTLFVALTHYRLGGGMDGGVYHVHTTVPVDDLSAGSVPFELDMCDGGVMWSQDNCEYNLVVILDQDGNQGPENLVPSPGEPATRVGGVQLTCDTEALCLDVELDCLEGDSCVQFTDPSACTCEPGACSSDFAICT